MDIITYYSLHAIIQPDYYLDTDYFHGAIVDRLKMFAHFHGNYMETRKHLFSEHGLPKRIWESRKVCFKPVSLIKE